MITRGVWNPQPKNAVICQVETDWGRSVGAAARSALEADGWKIVAEDYFKDGETEFYPLAGKWRDLDARLIVISDSTVSTSAAVKQAREVGVKALIMAQNLSTLVPEWYSMVGDASDYALDIISTFSKPEAKVFVPAFKTRFGYEPTTGGVGFSYDIALFFIKVANRTIEKYGGLTRDSFYKVCMEEVNTGKLTLKEGVTMPEYRYTPETLPEPVVAPDGWTFYGAQLFGGKQTFVWPPSVAEAQIVLPPWLK
jgi:branched-chain amino acid transport system substrate-binding protein